MMLINRLARWIHNKRVEQAVRWAIHAAAAYRAAPNHNTLARLKATYILLVELIALPPVK